MCWRLGGWRYTHNGAVPRTLRHLGRCPRAETLNLDAMLKQPPLRIGKKWAPIASNRLITVFPKQSRRVSKQSEVCPSVQGRGRSCDDWCHGRCSERDGNIEIIAKPCDCGGQGKGSAKVCSSVPPRPCMRKGHSGICRHPPCEERGDPPQRVSSKMLGTKAVQRGERRILTQVQELQYSS
jgi:hypothetical protein